MERERERESSRKDVQDLEREKEAFGPKLKNILERIKKKEKDGERKKGGWKEAIGEGTSGKTKTETGRGFEPE